MSSFITQVTQSPQAITGAGGRSPNLEAYEQFRRRVKREVQKQHRKQSQATVTTGNHFTGQQRTNPLISPPGQHPNSRIVEDANKISVAVSKSSPLFSAKRNSSEPSSTNPNSDSSIPIVSLLSAAAAQPSSLSADDKSSEGGDRCQRKKSSQSAGSVKNGNFVANWFHNIWFCRPLKFLRFGGGRIDGQTGEDAASNKQAANDKVTDGPESGPLQDPKIIGTAVASSADEERQIVPVVVVGDLQISTITRSGDSNEPQSPLPRDESTLTVSTTNSGPALMAVDQRPEEWSFLLPIPEPEFHRKKCLVIDLDETLVHSCFNPIPDADFVIPVEMEQQVLNVYVKKRPHVDEFLRLIGPHFEIVIFTASLSKYADPVIDALDPNRVVRHRLFRSSCVHHRGSFVKDLSRLGRNLKDIIILDNSPVSYLFHPSNAVPVTSWFADVHDTELLDMVPLLLELREVENVVQILGDGEDDSAEEDEKYFNAGKAPFDLDPSLSDALGIPHAADTSRKPGS